MGAAWGCVIALGLLATRRRTWPPGTRFWLFLAAYSLGSFLIGFTRADEVPLLAGWRADQIMDGVLLIVGLSQVVRGSVLARRKDTHGRISA